MAGMTGSQAYALSRRYTNKKVGNGTGSAGSAGSEFDHVQTTPSAVWTVTHSLGERYPCVLCLDEDGNTIIGEIEYYSENVTIITFCTPVKGTAHFNHGGLYNALGDIGQMLDTINGSSV